MDRLWRRIKKEDDKELGPVNIAPRKTPFRSDSNVNFFIHTADHIFHKYTPQYKQEILKRN